MRPSPSAVIVLGHRVQEANMNHSPGIDER